jgi:hypothetical protein
MEIPDIRIKGGDIDIIRIPFTPDYLLEPPQALQVPVPITNQIGVPIVDIPGCVEAHEVDENNMLEDDDPKGVKVYCDGQQPSFNPIDYNANKLKFEQKADVPPVAPPPETPEAKTPEIPKKGATVEIKCPTEAQELKEPVGTLVDAGKKKIVEYKLIGKECIPIKEDLKLPDQIIKAIPSAGQVTTTASIAVVATAAAAATPFLLKVVKPIVKQIIKKVQKALGKEPPKLSQNEIQANKFREKRGLPPLKQPKKKK